MYSLKIMGEIIRDFLFFPFWWYSLGLVEFVKSLWDFLYNRHRALALDIWVKNIFRPMYGQTDWQGMLISFFMRLLQIIFRSLVMLIYFAAALAMLLLWLGLPVLVFSEIIFQIII